VARGARDSRALQRAWEARAAAGNEGRFSSLAAYLMWSGRTDAAVSELLRHWQNPWRAMFMRMSVYEPLRADPRFRTLLDTSQQVRARVRWR
jgi:hypothetical protein